MKNKAQRKALIQTVAVLTLLILGAAAFLVWASKATDSELAQSVRGMVGIKNPNAEPPPPPPAPVVVEIPPEPVVVEPVVVEPEPIQLPEISYREIYQQRHLWPKTLNLNLSKRVYIRYNGNVYGYTQFSSGMELKVDGLSAKGEVFGTIDGNYLNFTIEETNFEEWFRTTYADRYVLLPIEIEPVSSGATARHKVGTPEGDADFWREMRIWCDRNYDSISLKIEDDTLVFRWLPQEEVPIDYAMEAREIARTFLMKRSALGSNENYAACEIRHPVSGELLGTSSIFIPRL